MLSVNNVNSDSIEASLSTIKYITRLYAGKALPNVGKNLVCLLNPCTNVAVASLCMYWELLKQNAFSSDIKCVIVDSDSLSDSLEDNQSLSEIYYDLISDMKSHDNSNSNSNSNETCINHNMIEVVDSNLYSNKSVKNIKSANSINLIKTKTKSKPIKRMAIDKRSELCVVSDDCDDIMNIISTINPDIIIFNNLSSQMNLISKICKNIESSVDQNASTSHNISVISFTNDEQNLTRIPKDHSYEIAYRTSTCFEKIIRKSHTLHIDLMKIIDLKNTVNIMKKLDLCVKHVEKQILMMNVESILTKKMVVVLDSAITVNNLYNYFKKNRCYYDCLDDVNPYNSANRDDVLKFSQISPHTNRFNESGILFINSDNINDILAIRANIIDNIDFLIILDDTLKENHITYQKLITSLFLNVMPKQHLVFVEIAENNLHQQLYRLSKIFYDNNATNVQLFNELKSGIESGMIKLDVEFNDMRQDKLERMFKITTADKRYDNRHNIVYMITVSKSQFKSPTIYYNYKTEKDILNNEISDDILADEFHAIVTAKKGCRNIPNYSGAKWISRNDKIETEGNKIGFIDETADTISICEIIGTKNYTRREKRPEWKEKDCKNKNVLFLSSIKGEYKLSNFKKEMKLNKTARIDYMQDFEVDLGI